MKIGSLVAALAVTLAACSGSSSSTTGTTGTSGSTSTTGTHGASTTSASSASAATTRGATGTSSSTSSSTTGSSGSTTSATSSGATSGTATGTATATGSTTGTATGTTTSGNTAGTTSGGTTTGTATSTGSSSSSGGNCNATAYQSCTTASACNCGQSCVTDPAFTGKVCEPTCGTDSSCVAAATCQSGTCAVSLCLPAALAGAGCTTANSAFSTSGSGTCVPQSEFGFSICMPAGTAAGSNCDDGNADPAYAYTINPAVLTVDLTAGESTASFCPQTKACYLGSCEVVCSTSANGCGTSACIAQDDMDTSWGLCGACLTSGSNDCLINSDCCAGLTCQAGTCG